MAVTSPPSEADAGLVESHSGLRRSIELLCEAIKNKDARIEALTAEVERLKRERDAEQHTCEHALNNYGEVMDRALAAEARLASIEAEVRLWLNSDHIQLHAGEMTAQELRSVKAVVSAIAAAIRSGEG